MVDLGINPRLTGEMVKQMFADVWETLEIAQATAGHDPEMAHFEGDLAIERMLLTLGFDEIVEAWKNTRKSYA